MPSKANGVDTHMLALRRWGNMYLAPQENAVWQKLIRKAECRVVDLYDAARPNDNREYTIRQQQQSVGFVASRINKRLVKVNSKYRVKVGEARFTYRLIAPDIAPEPDVVPDVTPDTVPDAVPADAASPVE